MAGNENELLLQFMKSGIYKFPASNTFFIDPVRLLNRNYTNFRVSPCSYYSRFFNLSSSIEEQNLEDKHDGFLVATNCGKRKRYRKNKNKQKCYSLNEKELLADKRHQEIRGLLVNAHEELVRDKELLDVICELKYENEGWERCVEYNCGEVKERENFSLIELGKVWQASFYEIALYFTQDNEEVGDNGGSLDIKHDDIRLFPIFNTLVSNETDNHMVAEFQTTRYILPKKSCFCMSELEQIHSIVPADTECGYNFIMIDPPWENRSAYQKSKYPTLPNRHFLSIPVKKIAHLSGALVALWVTNREKLRNFVENELFPAWGVKFAATLYWLKVKANGSLICDLNLFHHRPYECLLLGYTGGEVMTMEKALKDQIVMSIPGDYSRKPPLGDLLMQYVPGPRPAHCIELFAREMMSGWTSWGNEPLHFQEMRYFSSKITGKCTN